jgi:hypothetical protein
MLAIMETPRDDGNELCERLLDMPTSELDGSPRRFGTDNRTWYKFLEATPNLGLLPAIRRVCDDTPSFEDCMLVHSYDKKLEEWCGASRGQGKLDSDHDVFVYDNQSGCVVCLWQDARIQHDTRLVCRGCDQVFDFALGADMATMQGIHDMFLSRGHNVVVHPSKIEFPDPDLVCAKPDDPIRRDAPSYVIEALRSGRHRRWYCIQCRHVQGYPATFFLP